MKQQAQTNVTNAFDIQKQKDKEICENRMPEIIETIKKSSFDGWKSTHITGKVNDCMVEKLQEYGFEAEICYPIYFDSYMKVSWEN